MIVQLLFMNINFTPPEMSILFRGFFVIFFSLIIFLTKDEGHKETEKINN